MSTWTKARVLIRDGGSQELRADVGFVSDMTPGLAITVTNDTRPYVLTHVESGCAVAIAAEPDVGHFKTRKWAERTAEALRAAGDWRGSAATIRGDETMTETATRILREYSDLADRLSGP